MGGDKPRQLLAGTPLLRYPIAALARAGLPVAVVTKPGCSLPRPLPPAVRVLLEGDSDHHPLCGIVHALRTLEAEAIVVLACDMPFVSTALLRALLAQAAGVDAVVPVIGEQPEPLHAVYRPSCLPAIEAALAAGRKRLLAFFDAVRVRYVPEAELRRWDPELRSFLNVNWPDDLARARALGT